MHGLQLSGLVFLTATNTHKSPDRQTKRARACTHARMHARKHTHTHTHTHTGVLARELERLLPICPDIRRFSQLLFLMHSINYAPACEAGNSAQAKLKTKSVFAQEVEDVLKTLAQHPHATRTASWRHNCRTRLAMSGEYFLPGENLLKDADCALAQMRQQSVGHDDGQPTVGTESADTLTSVVAAVAAAYGLKAEGHGLNRWVWKCVVARVTAWRGVDRRGAEAALARILSHVCDGFCDYVPLRKPRELGGHDLEAIMELYHASRMPSRAAALIGSKAVARGARILSQCVSAGALQRLGPAGLQGLVECVTLASAETAHGETTGEGALGVRVASLVGHCGLEHAAQVVLAAAALAVASLNGPAGRQGFCRVFVIMLGAWGFEHEEVAGTEVMLRTREQEVTSLAVMTVLDAVLPLLAASASEGGVCFDRLVHAAEAVATARRPDGARFPAHVQVGARVQMQLLLLIRAQESSA